MKKTARKKHNALPTNCKKVCPNSSELHNLLSPLPHTSFYLSQVLTSGDIYLLQCDTRKFFIQNYRKIVVSVNETKSAVYRLQADRNEMRFFFNNWTTLRSDEYENSPWNVQSSALTLSCKKASLRCWYFILRWWSIPASPSGLLV